MPSIMQSHGRSSRYTLASTDCRRDTTGRCSYSVRYLRLLSCDWISAAKFQKHTGTATKFLS